MYLLYPVHERLDDQLLVALPRDSFRHRASSRP
jgi:hypothetical protein